MPTNFDAKAELRRLMRQRRRDLDAGRQARAAEALAQRVEQLDAWRHCARLALYLPADGEIATAGIALRARARAMQLFLPVLAADGRLDFALWQAQATLRPNRLNIPEPPPGAARCTPDQLDILCLPLVAWDRRGGRLGMGGGFYDRSLAGAARPLLVGLAHSCQEVEQVPRDDWDIELDYVATESALLDCRG
ncbi:MAG: 5-formyltetrahydrofolate cyclo-ligase [Halioglobus sp.]|nr:5-formyltetrahydrofolate cyclo-ligase [Halioglobus sp.]